MHFNRLGYGLSIELWIVQAGIFLSMLGYGAVLPFEIIYLHDGRGFSLGVAGLVVGTVTGLAVVATPFAGAVIDRAGARTTAAGACMALAAGYAGLAFAHTPAQAFAAATAAGIGNGGLLPSQSALLASLAPPELRHRAFALSRVAGNIGLGLGGALGGLVAAHGLNGFVALLLANAITYVLYMAILVVAVREDARPQPIAGGYRLLLRDRPFIRLALTNVAAIAVGWGVFTWIVPPYAGGELGIGPRVLGLLLFANALTVVIAQIPVAKLAEGRRRAVTMASGSLTFVVACLLVVVADLAGRDFAYAALIAAAIAFGVGECLHTTALSPLVADLAPPALRGRYMATIGVSFWLGLALAPTLGTQLLSTSPAAALLVPAAVALAAALSALALERELPAAIRLHPARHARSGDRTQPRDGSRARATRRCTSSGQPYDRHRSSPQDEILASRCPSDPACLRRRCRPNLSGSACVSQGVGSLGHRSKGSITMRFALRLVTVTGVCVGLGVVAAPVAGAADTQPPTAPSNVRVLAVKPDTVTIAFTGSTDNVGLKWYVARVEGVREQPTTSPGGAEVGGLKSDTTYSLTVVAVDKAGNVSAPSAPVAATTAKWTPPTNVRVTSVSGGTVSLAWNASSNMPQAYGYLVYDGGRGEAVAGDSGATMQRLAPGTHVFTVRAMHSSGDLSPASTPVTVTVAPRGSDQAAPTAPQNVLLTEDLNAYKWVMTWDPSTDNVDPAPAYDVLKEYGGDLFAIRYAVSGTSYRGQFPSAVRAVDLAGNRSAPTPATLVW